MANQMRRLSLPRAVVIEVDGDEGWLVEFELRRVIGVEMDGEAAATE